MIFRNNEVISSNVVTIGNAPLQITSLKLLSEVFKTGVMLSVEPDGTDADGDNVSIIVSDGNGGTAKYSIAITIR